MHSDVERILESTRKRIDSTTREVESVDARDIQVEIDDRSDRGLIPVISEVKSRSPSKPSIDNRDPVEIAGAMEKGGAVAISVLTEPEFFGGSIDRLRRVRRAVDLPVLRKDFILDESQLFEVEADIVLLIARFLDGYDDLIDTAHDIGMQVLVETHTEDELVDAVDSDADLIGVNNRDLSRLEVDLGVGEELLGLIPGDRIALAESGIKTRGDAIRMMDAGADALLIGTSIMERGDVEEGVRYFVEART